MSQSQLVGYVRKSRKGGALRLSIDTRAFANAERYVCQDGREFVNLVVNADKVTQILGGQREVTSLCQLTNGE